MQRRVAVLGADGFIGNHVCINLQKRGMEPIAFARNADRLRSMGFEAVSLDLSADQAADTDHWRKLLSDCSGLINCAGILTGTNSVFEAVHVAAPKAAYAALPKGAHAVLVSAVGINADTSFSLYRRKGEQVASDAQATIVRAGLVLGDTSYGGSSLIRALAAVPFRMPVLQRDPMFNPIHADDLSNALIDLLDQPQPGMPLELGGSETLSLSAIQSQYRCWLGLKLSPTWPVPNWILRFSGWFGDLFRFGPISRTSLAQIEADVIANSPDSFEPMRGFSAFYANRPSGTADLWQARLYLLKPLIRLVLGFLWIASGLVGLFLPSSAFLPLFQGGVFNDQTLILLARLFGVIDLALGVALLRGWKTQTLAYVQAALVLGYTVFLTLLSPTGWLAPFGGMIKNIPILALIAVHGVLEKER